MKRLRHSFTNQTSRLLVKPKPLFKEKRKGVFLSPARNCIGFLYGCFKIASFKPQPSRTRGVPMIRRNAVYCMGCLAIAEGANSTGSCALFLFPHLQPYH